MPKVKISEYSATANSNTDVASINIDEGCAPSGINNAIRAVMGHLKDFQQGTNGDPFNGPHNGTVGATTPSTGAFTTVSASGIVTSTATAGQVVKAESGTTGILYSNFANTGGTFLYGIDNSAGTALFSGSAAYAGFIGTSGARPLVLATNGAGRAFIDSSGNVGIGETNPASPLQITSSIAPTSGSILRIDGTATTTYSGTGYVGGQIRINFTNATSRYAGINFSNTGATSQDFFGAVQNASGYNDFVWQGFSGSYLERMRLDSSGNLGLGVTPNAWGGTNNSKGLQVGRAGAVSYSSDDARVALSANAFGSASNGWNFINNGGAAYYSISDFDNNHRWFVATTTSGTAGNAITFTQAMTLDASGNLIVGGTSPTGRLTVADGTSSVLTLRATTAVDADGRVIGTINFQEPEGTGDGTLAIEAAISGLRSGTDSFNSGGRLAFYTRPFNGTLTQAMTLDASGNLLVGITSATSKLTVNGEIGVIDNFALRLGSNQAGGATLLYNNNGNLDITPRLGYNTVVTSGNLLVGTTSAEGRATIRGAVSDSSAFTFSTEAQDGTDQFRVRCDGAIYMGLDGSSPYNLTTGNAANAHLETNGYLYRSTSSIKYKTNVQDATHGLAEVLNLRPVTYEGISEVDSGKTFGGLIAEEVHEAGLTEFVQYNSEGEPDALAYGNMVSLCVKAIQEMKAIIDTQASTITQLTARITALEGA